MIATRPLEVEDFSLGITDYFIDGPPQGAETMDNLVLNPNKKPRTRWGSVLYQEEQMPLGGFRGNKLFFYEEDTLLAFQQKRGYFVDAGSWAEILGPSSGAVFTLGDANSLISQAEWQEQYFLTNSDFSSPQKIFRDNLGDFQVRNAGLPDIPSGISVANPPGTGASYLYAFVFKYQYQTASFTFIDRGPVTYYPTIVAGGTITAGNAAAITLPTTLTSNENWDPANIKVEVYRTVDGGDVYYYVDEVTLGTAAYNDEEDDSTIQANETLYTTAGDFSNSPPPPAKFVHVVNNVGYWAHIKEDGQTFNQLLRQSIPGDPDSVPKSFFTETEQPIKGLSSIYDRPLVFCNEYVYRIDNIISSTGVGSIDLRRIDDKAGCVSQDSIVQTHQGVFWAGRVGFYWSDGFKVKKISNHLNERYKEFVLNDDRKNRIVGTYDPSNERIYWSVCREDGNNEPDRCMVLDLKFGIRDESTFTTISGGDYFRPTALVFLDDVLYRGDTRGFVIQHESSLFTDPKIDVLSPPADWEELTIIHDYKSCFLDFDSKFYRKFVPRVLVSAANTTNLSLAIASSNDNNRVVGDLKPIRYVSNITWGDDLPLWGDSEARWNYQGLIEEWRRFPARGLRCNYKQIQFTNAAVQIVTSDLLGLASVDSGALTATLGGSFKWLPGSVDYVISFENDDYTVEYLITARTDTTITFSDPNGNVPITGSYNWVIRGKPKGEVLELNGYVLHWAYLSKSQTPFSASSLGSTP